MAYNTLSNLRFGTDFVDSLPRDLITENYQRQVDKACYSVVSPTAFPKSSLIAYSEALAQELDIHAIDSQTQLFTDIFSGTHLPKHTTAYASCYGGHQFGQWAGQLGDGRAINLGELKHQNGQQWTLQLKGSGPTPYSRSADGLAVLRSSVREFLCSEAMFYLGVPTTRALSLIGTGEKVERDMFYNGNPKLEPGAIVCRAAPSFLRFGNFELQSYRNNITLLKQLADFTINNYFSYLGKPSKAVYAEWFKEVCLLTSKMVVEWMRVGFVHGVMNTDNLSILGLTIDYGPYGWLENYDPTWTPNTTDAQRRRYRFGQQPQIALWNLLQLGNAIYPLVEDAQILESALEAYKQDYDFRWREMMSAKLGLQSFKPETDEALIQSLLDILQKTDTDMTLFFRHLSELNPESNLNINNELDNIIKVSSYNDKINLDTYNEFKKWLEQYLHRLKEETISDEVRKQNMNSVNPKYVLRNYLAQLAIDKSEQGDHSMIHELMHVLQTPYTEQEGKDHLAQKRPDWAKERAGCSMLSCSS